MSIFDISGDTLNSAYDKSGTPLTAAYDLDGIAIFPDGPQPPTTIKVMEYNVGQWYYGSSSNVPAEQDAEYYALQNGMIANANADILLICEYRDQFSQAGRTALSMLSQYYPYIVHYGGRGAYMGRAICSKYPISNYMQRNYTTGTTNYYDSATVTINNVPITLVVTHLNYSSNMSTRVAQLRELIAFLQTKDTFICGGDFNTLDCKSTSGADYIGMMQLVLDAGFHAANCTDFGFIETYSDEPTGTWTGCLDNIVTSPNIEIVSAERDATKLTDELTEKTDHMPLIAVIEIQRQQKTALLRWNKTTNHRRAKHADKQKLVESRRNPRSENRGADGDCDHRHGGAD